MPGSLLASPSPKRVKLGVIGTGLRGQWVLSLAAKYPEVDIPAICDIDETMLASALKILKDAGKPKPRVYRRGEEDFRRMLSTEDLEGVYIATPWRWHHPMAVTAMKNGMQVGTEVPAALSVEECWDLVKTSQQTGMNCMIMENVCYRRDVMAILNMVQQGLFGELLHCQGGYQHDLRHVKFNNAVTKDSQKHAGELNTLLIETATSTQLMVWDRSAPCWVLIEAIACCISPLPRARLAGCTSILSKKAVPITLMRKSNSSAETSSLR